MTENKEGEGEKGEKGRGKCKKKAGGLNHSAIDFRNNYREWGEGEIIPGGGGGGQPKMNFVIINNLNKAK